MNKKIDKAYMTVITNMSYFKGLKVLVKTIKKTKTLIPVYVLVPDTASSELKENVQSLGAELVECQHIQIDDDAKKHNKQKNWNETFFKLNIMRLEQFRKIVYIDSDMIVLHNLDHLFEWPSLSATTGGKAAHPEWVEFNSGLMVIEPSEEEFSKLTNAIPSAIERKMSMGLGYGDQDVFNEVYRDWNQWKGHNFGEIYNAEINFLEELMRENGYKTLEELYVLHYIGHPKIWNNSLVKNLRIIRGCYADKNYAQAHALLLFLKYLYF